MTSIKVKFRPSSTEGQEGTIYYQIICRRQVRRMATPYRLFADEWDEQHSQATAKSGSERKATVLAVRQQIRWDLERLSRISKRLASCNECFTADDVAEEFERYTSEYTLFNFMQKIIARQRNNGRVRTAETYASTLSSIRKFRNGEDIMLDSITPETMEEYEGWLRSRGLVPNSIGFYTRILRAVYRTAVSEEIIEDRNPFRKVYTGVDKTLKRALPLPNIKRLMRLDLSGEPSKRLARDMFLMSFYLRGMSFVDMAFLKKSDLANGILTYRRRKTGQRLTIAWEPEMQRILDGYPENKTDYLLPIITNPDSDTRYAYRNKGYAINSSLKKIAARAGIEGNLTLYVARHSWASVAKAKGVPLSVISEGMGHDSESTTRIYLASLDTSVVDRANSMILRSLA